MKLGYDEPFTEKDLKPRNKLLKILSDGKWHRYSEIEKVKLSSATISKYLKALLTDNKIERRTDPDDWRGSQYRIKTEGLMEFKKSRDIQLIIDHTFGEMRIPEGVVKEIIEEEGLVKEDYGIIEKLTIDKESKFLSEEYKQENIEWLTDAISIKHYLHGVPAYKYDKRVIKVFVKYLLENMRPPIWLAAMIYKNPHQSTRDFIVTLSIMPKTTKQFEETDGYKLRMEERFIRWAKTFHDKEIDLDSISAHQEIFEEFKKRWDEYGEMDLQKMYKKLGISK